MRPAGRIAGDDALQRRLLRGRERAAVNADEGQGREPLEHLEQEIERPGQPAIVRVEEADERAACGGEAEVAGAARVAPRRRQQAHARVVRMGPLQDRAGIVRRGIVDDDDLDARGRVLVEDRGDRAQQQFAAIVRRNDDAHDRRHGVSHDGRADAPLAWRVVGLGSQGNLQPWQSSLCCIPVHVH